MRSAGSETRAQQEGERPRIATVRSRGREVFARRYISGAACTR